MYVVELSEQWLQVILYKAFFVWHLPARPASQVWHVRLPAGQGGGSEADLVRILARVLPLFHAIRTRSPVDLTAPFTLRARVSSIYGSEMYVCCSTVALCGEDRLLC